MNVSAAVPAVDVGPVLMLVVPPGLLDVLGVAVELLPAPPVPVVKEPGTVCARVVWHTAAAQMALRPSEIHFRMT